MYRKFILFFIAALIPCMVFANQSKYEIPVRRAYSNMDYYLNGIGIDTIHDCKPGSDGESENPQKKGCLITGQLFKCEGYLYATNSDKNTIQFCRIGEVYNSEHELRKNEDSYNATSQKSMYVATGFIDDKGKYIEGLPINRKVYAAFDPNNFNFLVAQAEKTTPREGTVGKLVDNIGLKKNIKSDMKLWLDADYNSMMAKKAKNYNLMAPKQRNPWEEKGAPILPEDDVLTDAEFKRLILKKIEGEEVPPRLEKDILTDAEIERIILRKIESEEIPLLPNEEIMTDAEVEKLVLKQIEMEEAAAKEKAKKKEKVNEVKTEEVQKNYNTEVFESNEEATTLDRYVDSQLPCPPQKADYAWFKKELGADVTKAQEVFKISKNYLTCLILKESKFKITAKSSSDAKGLGQTMRIASQEGMRFYLLGLRITDQDYKEITKRISNIRNQIAAGGSKNSVRLKEELLRLNLNAGFYKMNRMWKAYANYLAENGLLVNQYKTLPEYAKKRVSKYDDITGEDIRNLNVLYETGNPHVSVGLTAMYLKTIQSKFDLENEDPAVTIGNLKRHIIMAGAYNAGDAIVDRAQSDCANKANMDVGEESQYESCLLQNIKNDNDETSSYTRSIESCLKSDLNVSNTGYSKDFKGTELPDDNLSRNQTETTCFLYGSQLAGHRFAKYMSCNDTKKIYGMYAPLSESTNPCTGTISPELGKKTKEDLTYISNLLKNNGFSPTSQRASIIHSMGKGVPICSLQKGQKGIPVMCKSGGCPKGYTAGTGYYATVSAPDEFLTCPQRRRAVPGKKNNLKVEPKKGAT